ncbi:MAG: OmpA family protein [Bacteroidota bacterium]
MGLVLSVVGSALSPSDSYAQYVDFGMTLGAYGGQTDYRDNQARFLARMFVRHDGLLRNLQGEVNIGLGTVSGVQYRTRLIPMEYRFIYKPREINNRLRPEFFAGVGALYFKPIEIARPDDPLTVEVGPRIRASSLWGYSNGITPVIPVGASMEYKLDQSTALRVGAHYTQSFSRRLAASTQGFFQGYWGLTIGIHFLKPQPKPPAPPRIQLFEPPPLPEPAMTLVVPEANSMREWARSEIERDTVFFDYFKARIKSEQRDRVDRIAFLLEAYPQLDLTLEGHTDSRGYQWFNLPLSKERAWTVSKYIMQRGIGPDRLSHTGYGEARPEYDNDTKQGRSKNRRVTFATSITTEGSSGGVDERLAQIAIDSTLFDEPITISFDSQSEDFSDDMGSTFDQIAVNMRRNEELAINVQGFPSSIGKRQSRIFWANRRAEVIRLELMKRGIAYERIHISYIDPQGLNEIKEFDKAIIQQTD